MRTTLALEDFTQDEKNAVWYTPTEIKEIRSKVRHDITLLATGRLMKNHSSNFELRGLESFLPEGLAVKQLRRRIARDAVLDTQEHQWKKKCNDPELLADIYFDRTRESVATAHVQGLADQEIAHHIHECDGSSETSSTRMPSKALFKSGSIGSSLHRRQPREILCRAA